MLEIVVSAWPPPTLDYSVVTGVCSLVRQKSRIPSGNRTGKGIEIMYDGKWRYNCAGGADVRMCVFGEENSRGIRARATVVNETTVVNGVNAGVFFGFRFTPFATRAHRLSLRCPITISECVHTRPSVVVPVDRP